MDKEWVEKARGRAQQAIYLCADEFGRGDAWARTVVYLVFLEEASFSLRGQAESSPQFSENEHNVKAALEKLLADVTDTRKARALQRYWNMASQRDDPVAEAAEVLGVAILKHTDADERLRQFRVGLSELIASVGFEEMAMPDVADELEFILRQIRASAIASG